MTPPLDSDSVVRPEQASGLEAHFIDPTGSNKESMRRLGYRFVDLLVDSASNAAQRPAFDRDAVPVPGPYHPSRQGRPASELVTEVEQVVRRSLNPAHPGYLGHMDTLASAIGIFSDAVISALNNNMLSWEMSPVFTEMESRILEWFTELFGLGGTGAANLDGDGGDPTSRERQAAGFLVSGGTLANMTAMLVARNARGGLGSGVPLTGEREPLVFFASENAHFSFRKAANLIGIGRDGWIPVAADDLGRVRIPDLERAIRDARAAGQRPFALVGVAGTTVTGSIDPLSELADIAAREHLWFHVDAAYGGATVLSPLLRDRLRGVERADSVTFNPQKWMYVPKTCASILFRDREDVDDHLRESFVYGNSNRRGVGEHQNLGEWTLQGTRRVDVLKLYLTLEHLGTDRMVRLIERHVELGQRLASWVEEEPELELLQRPDLNIVCFRYRGCEGKDDDARGTRVDACNAEIQKRVERAGHGWLSLSQYRGRKYLRAVILHPDTDEPRLRRILDDVLEAGRAVSGQAAR